MQGRADVDPADAYYCRDPPLPPSGVLRAMTRRRTPRDAGTEPVRTTPPVSSAAEAFTMRGRMAETPAAGRPPGPAAASGRPASPSEFSPEGRPRRSALRRPGGRPDP